jgi:hypothetical protein
MVVLLIIHNLYADWRDAKILCKWRATESGGTIIADSNRDHGDSSGQAERRESFGLFIAWFGIFFIFLQMKR